MSDVIGIKPLQFIHILDLVRIFCLTIHFEYINSLQVDSIISLEKLR